jgi:hypothetical protein
MGNRPGGLIRQSQIGIIGNKRVLQTNELLCKMHARAASARGSDWATLHSFASVFTRQGFRGERFALVGHHTPCLCLSIKKCIRPKPHNGTLRKTRTIRMVYLLPASKQHWQAVECAHKCSVLSQNASYIKFNENPSGGSSVVKQDEPTNMYVESI